jgi:cytochrome c oxidase subunit 1
MEHSSPVGTNFLNYPKGWMSWVYTLDHKRIGIMYLVTTLTWFLLGGIFATLIRIEHMTVGPGIFDATTYNRVFTYHGTIMVFMVIIPMIPAAIGNFILPLMLGAKDVAFPRLNLLSYYIFIAGSILALATLAFSGVDTGWTFYTPYSTRTGGAAALMVSAAFVLGFSSILTGVNFIATIHKMRAPGQGWSQIPLFLWSLYATSIIQILATPVLALTLMMLLAERIFNVGFFDPALGGDPVLFQHFFWFYSHPAV